MGRGNGGGAGGGGGAEWRALCGVGGEWGGMLAFSGWVQETNNDRRMCTLQTQRENLDLCCKESKREHGHFSKTFTSSDHDAIRQNRSSTKMRFPRFMKPSTKNLREPTFTLVEEREKKIHHMKQAAVLITQGSGLFSSHNLKMVSFIPDRTHIFRKTYF